MLFGDVNPAGRLPVTFYKDNEKLPPFDDYTMQGRTYRYFQGEPLYPFGHGLSYTKFEYSQLQVDHADTRPDGEVRVSLNVRNVGQRAGEEVVQLYLHPLDPRRQRAAKDLRGVERLVLQPGEHKQVSFTVRPDRDLTYYDVDRKDYAVDPGRYEVQIGASSADIRLQKAFSVSGR